MEARTNDPGSDPGLPLSSLRLIVPPLRLLSAAMWQVAKQKDVESYDKLQEFVCMVTEAFPGLLTHRQRAQLLLGLKARLILELCKGSIRGLVDSQSVQNYLDKLPITVANAEYRDAEVERTESTFIALVQSLLKDPAERAYFFQVVFPVEYGPSYDGALHILLWELLSKLEKVFPVPDFKQTVAWLNSDLCETEDLIETMPNDLSLIYRHHKNLGLLKMPYGPSSTIGSCIMSALSIPPSHKHNSYIGLEAMHNYANIINPIAYVESDQYSMVTVYEVEVEVGASDVGEDIEESSEEVLTQTDLSESQGVAEKGENASGEDVRQAMFTTQKVEKMAESVEITKALETLTKSFAPKNETVQDSSAMKLSDPTNELLDEEEAVGAILEGGEHITELVESTDEEEQVSVMVDLQPGRADDSGGPASCRQTEGELKSSRICQEVPGISCQDPESQKQPSTSLGNAEKSCHLQMETGQQILKLQKSLERNNSEQIMKQVEASIAPSVIAIKGINTDQSGEMISIIFTCPQCPLQDSEENGPPHIHMQCVPPEEFRALMEAKKDGAEFTPSPCSTDQIFTSIKVLPNGSSEQSKEECADGPVQQGAAVDTAQPQGRRKALACETCGRTFTRTSDVRRHQLTHTGERPFRCSRCDRTFQHSWDLAKHETKHHGAAIAFPCQLCGSSFANLRALTVHHKGSHSGESQLPQICSICSQSFPTAPELLEHRRSHGEGQRYACPQCGEAFDSLLARSQHRQSHHAKHQFKCPHCDKTYTRRSDVKRHQATHTGERPHQCGQCGKRFSLRFMLTKHLKVHTGERPFQCSHCPKRFTLVSILVRHERMHTGEKPFLCSQCGKGFLSQGELSKHHRSHQDDKPYSCAQCDKCFKSKKSQREHQLSHTGVRPYTCTHCGKGFTKLYALTRHNLIHTGERPFPCSHCSKTFLSLGEAQLHQRIHTGERPYACAACELKFKSSSELGRHRRSHSGQKPWRLCCERCGKTFASQLRLKKHLESHAEGKQAAPSGNSQTAETERLVEARAPLVPSK